MTKTLNQLTEITDLADDDLLLARDTSAVEDFKITIANLRKASTFNSVDEMKTRSLAVGSIVSTAGYYTPGDGGGNSYEIVAGATGTADGGSFIDLDNGLQAQGLFSNGANMLQFGADPTNTKDSTAAVNTYIQYQIAKVVSTGSAITDDTLPAKIELSPGVFSVSSVNLADLRGPRNIHILAWGCTLVGNTAGKVIVDALASRWLWLWGLTVIGDPSAAPKHGLQVGNKGAEACGNNKFFGVQCLGDYSLSPMANYGSETTQWYSCRFSTESLLPDTYPAYCDGQTLKVPTSDYVTVTRSLNTPVSFTNNAFYGCQFRHLGDEGNSCFLARTNGWLFDESCYFLAYNNSNITIWQASDSRNSRLTLGGLYETSQTSPPAGGATSGVQNTISIKGDGTNSELVGLIFKSRNPHAGQYVFAFDNLGTLSLPQINISIAEIPTSPSLKVFGPFASTLSISGSIDVNDANMLDMSMVDSFTGDILVDDYASMILPSAGAFSIRSSDTGTEIRTGDYIETFTGWSAASITTGVLTCDSKYNSISVAALTDITDIDTNFGVGLGVVIIRRIGAFQVVFKHNTAKLRNIGAVDVVLNANESITYAEVVPGVWQQIGGKI